MAASSKAPSMPLSLIITIVITHSQCQVRGAPRPLIWILDRVGRCAGWPGPAAMPAGRAPQAGAG